MCIRDRDYTDYTDEIVESFSIVADKVSTPVLLQTLAHFQYRNCEDLRTVMPKGNVAKIQLLDSFSQEIGDTTKLRVVIINALVKQYSKRSPLGNCLLYTSQSYLMFFFCMVKKIQ